MQTVASAAGTLSSIIFVLPGLIMIGWWTGFPFWMSFVICALGGILGVMYSIPLRRALVTNSDLPYPEGVACAEVLKVGSGGDKTNAAEVEHRQRRSARGGVGIDRGRGVCDHRRDASIRCRCGANFPRRRRGAVSGYDFSLSFALFAIGHLVGLSVGIAMLIGACIGWGWVVPHYLGAHRRPNDCGRRTRANAPGVTRCASSAPGAIGVSAIWTLLKLVKPVVSGLAGAMAASRARKAGKADTLPITERDIPIGIVGLITLVCMLPIGWVLGYFANDERARRAL